MKLKKCLLFICFFTFSVKFEVFYYSSNVYYLVCTLFRILFISYRLPIWFNHFLLWIFMRCIDFLFMHSSASFLSVVLVTLQKLISFDFLYFQIEKKIWMGNEEYVKS
jgi:hypothetical protein